MKKLLIVIAAIAATHTFPAFAIERDVIERAKIAFSEQLELTCTSGEPEWVAEDAVYQYALKDISVKLRVEGRDAVAAHLCALAQVVPAAIVKNVVYFPTLHQEMVYVQYDLVPVDAVGKASSSLAIIEMRDNQIAGFTQLSRSPESIEVLKAGNARIN